MFSEKCVVGPEKCFSPTDLYQYVDKLIREAIHQDRRCVASNYSWLKSRDLHDCTGDDYLDDLRPMINKMSSEGCAAIAVKLCDLTEETTFTISDLVTLIKSLLLEQDSMLAMEKNIKGGKETKNGKKTSKVRPELVGRQATVSFIVDANKVEIK